MTGVAENCSGVPLLHNDTRIHYINTIGDICHYTKVVGNIQQRHLTLLLELFKEIQDLAGFEAVLHYDPQVLRFDGLALGDFLSSTGNTVVPREAQVDPNAGTIALGGFSFGGRDSPGGSGTLVTVTFTVQGVGHCPLALSDVQLVRRCGLAHLSPTVVSERVNSGWSLYLPLILK